MAALSNLFGGETFNASEVEVNDFEPIPVGKYKVIIAESEVVETKNGLGNMLKVQLKVIDGKYKNRTVFDQFVVQHKTSSDAVRIGQQKLASICKSVGVSQLKDTLQLHNKPLIAAIKIEQSDQYGDRNIVKFYSSASQAANDSTQPETSQAGFEEDIPF